MEPHAHSAWRRLRLSLSLPPCCCSASPLPQAAKAAGNLTLERVLELKDSGVDVAGLLGEDMRQQLYRKEVRRSGAGQRQGMPEGRGWRLLVG